MTAIAAEPSTVLRIPRSLFLKMLEGFPDSAWRLRDYISIARQPDGRTDPAHRLGARSAIKAALRNPRRTPTVQATGHHGCTQLKPFGTICCRSPRARSRQRLG